MYIKEIIDDYYENYYGNVDKYSNGHVYEDIMNEYIMNNLYNEFEYMNIKNLLLIDVDKEIKKFLILSFGCDGNEEWFETEYAVLYNTFKDWIDDRINIINDDPTILTNIRNTKIKKINKKKNNF